VRIDALIAKKRRLIELLREKRQAVISHAVTKGLDPNAPMKDSGIEWVGEIPVHWEIKPLMYLTPATRQIMYGIVLPGPHFDGGVPIVKGGDVAPGRLRLAALNRTDPEIEMRYERSRLRGGDLVYAIRGSIGAVELVPKELEGANLTQDAARVAPQDGVNRRWLLHALRASPIFGQLEAGAVGATIRGINIRDLKRARLPVPPVEEQGALAAFCDAENELVDQATEAVERAVATLDEHRAALVAAAVTGKIDVRGQASEAAEAAE
jgi:type I restriction enzyme S subunit